MTATINPAAHRTPKGVKDACPPAIADALKSLHNKSKGLSGADITRALLASKVDDPHGHIARMRGTNNPGLVLRTYMRSHGSYVGRGGTYGMTIAQASKIAAGFIAGVAPSQVWFRGEVVVKDDA